MKFILTSSNISINYTLKIVSYFLYLFAVLINFSTNIETTLSFLNWITIVTWVSVSLYMIKKNFGSYADFTLFLSLVVFQVSEYGIVIVIVILQLNNIVAVSMADKKIFKSRFSLIFVNFLGIWISMITQNEILFVILNSLLILNLFLGSIIKLIIFKTSLNIGRVTKKPFLIPNSFFGMFLLLAQTLAIYTLSQSIAIEFKSLLQPSNFVDIVLILILVFGIKIRKNYSFFRFSLNFIFLIASFLFIMFLSIETLFLISVSLVIYKIMIDSIFLPTNFNLRINHLILSNMFIFIYYLATDKSNILLYTTLLTINLLVVPLARKKITEIYFYSAKKSQKSREQFMIEQLEVFSKVINSTCDPYKYLKYYDLTGLNITNHYEIYLTYGWKYGYSISELIPEYWYQTKLKRFGFLHPSFNWIIKDLDENFQILPEIDSNWMKSKYSLKSPTRYYFTQGWKEGLSPNPLFDLVHSYRRQVFHSLKDALNSICDNRFG